MLLGGQTPPAVADGTPGLPYPWSPHEGDTTHLWVRVGVPRSGLAWKGRRAGWGGADKAPHSALLLGSLGGLTVQQTQSQFAKGPTRCMGNMCRLSTEPSAMTPWNVSPCPQAGKEDGKGAAEQAEYTGVSGSTCFPGSQPSQPGVDGNAACTPEPSSRERSPLLPSALTLDWGCGSVVERCPACSRLCIPTPAPQNSNPN